MPRVHTVNKARKDYPDHGINAGEKYFWWKFRFGPKRMSKTPPTRQQLTQSDFYISLYDLEDRISDLEADDTMKSEVESIIEDIRSLADEQEEKKSNMPEGLQNGDTGQLLDERKDGLEEWADELEGIDLEVDEDELLDEVKEEMEIEGDSEVSDDKKVAFDERLSEKKKEAYRQKLYEVQGCSHNL